jgi:hypothetical protein
MRALPLIRHSSGELLLSQEVKLMTWVAKGNDNQRAEANNLPLGYWIKQRDKGQ